MLLGIGRAFHDNRAMRRTTSEPEEQGKCRLCNVAIRHHSPLRDSDDRAYLPSMTSVDLMITVTASPGASLSRSAEALLISETISWPLTSMMTSAMTAQSLTLLTLPLS